MPVGRQRGAGDWRRGQTMSGEQKALSAAGLTKMNGFEGNSGIYRHRGHSTPG